GGGDLGDRETEGAVLGLRHLLARGDRAGGDRAGDVAEEGVLHPPLEVAGGLLGPRLDGRRHGLPGGQVVAGDGEGLTAPHRVGLRRDGGAVAVALGGLADRKSTRLNSSHVKISYA